MTFDDLVPAPPHRFDSIERPYTPADVAALRGSVAIEHTLARRGAHRLWELLHSEDYIHALGAMTGNQAMQMVRAGLQRSGEHTSELQSLMRISSAVFCLNKKKKQTHQQRKQKATTNNTNT